MRYGMHLALTNLSIRISHRRHKRSATLGDGDETDATEREEHEP